MAQPSAIDTGRRGPGRAATGPCARTCRYRHLRAASTRRKALLLTSGSTIPCAVPRPSSRLHNPVTGRPLGLHVRHCPARHARYHTEARPPTSRTQLVNTAAHRRNGPWRWHRPERRDTKAAPEGTALAYRHGVPGCEHARTVVGTYYWYTQIRIRTWLAP